MADYIVESGEVSSGIILENNSMTVLDGGIATDTTINSGGSLVVSSGGTVENTTVDYGLLYVSSGGTANRTTVVNGGLGSGAGVIYVMNGVANDTTISRGWMDVSSGGIANRTKVDWYGSMFVYTSGTANGVVVNNSSAVLHVGYAIENGAGGYFWLGSGGTVNNAVVSTGSMNVAFGGIANGITVNRYGKLTVSTGGTANNAVVSAGSIIVSSGGTATETEVFSGSMVIFSGGVADNTHNGYGRIIVSSGGTAINTRPDYSGGLNVLSGGVASNILMVNRGLVNISSGGTMTGRLISLVEGSVHFDSGAILEFDLTQVLPGAATIYDSLGSFTGIPDYSITVNDSPTEGIYVLVDRVQDFNQAITVRNTSGAELGTISVGETASILGTDYLLELSEDNVLTLKIGDTITPLPYTSDGLVVHSSAAISGGEVFHDTWIASGGRLDILSGGVADSVTPYLGTLNVSSGGIASNIENSGTLNVSSGGIASGIENRGNAHIFSGGTVSNIVGRDANVIVVESGGTATGIKESGGWVDVKEGATVTFESNSFSDRIAEYNISMTVHSGTTANNTTVVSSGRFDVLGGNASDTVISNRGSMFISSGGTANSTIVSSGGTFGVFDGNANDTVIDRGGSMIISSGGTANSTIVSSGGSMLVSSGGTANSTTVNLGGRLIVAGKLTGQMILKAAAIVSSENGAILDFDISGLTPDAGARVNNLSLVKGTPLYTLTVSAEQVNGVYILAEGAAEFNSTITVQNTSGEALGTLTVGNTLTIGNISYTLSLDDSNLSVTVSGGKEIFTGNLTSETKDITSERAAVNVNVNELGRLNILDGGTATNTTVNSGGSMFVSSGGIANNDTVNGFGTIYVCPGGTANHTTVNSRGYLSISSGGVANNVIITSEGKVATGGTVVNALVNGRFTVISRGKWTGQIIFQDNASVSMGEGAILDFDISELTPEAEARVNNLAIIQGTPLYTLTVSDTQASGTYTLAEGASKFKGTLTVQNVSGETFGTLTVGNTLTVGKTDYLLSMDGSDLTVTIHGGREIFTGDLTNETKDITSDWSAVDVNVNEGGQLNILDGGTADNTTVNSGGWLSVLSGGTANSTTVNEGGYLDVSSGGTATEIVENGGYVWLQDNANATFKANTFSGLVLSNASATVHSGTTATNATVNAGGRLEVFSGGTANNTTVNRGGNLNVSSGGVANSTTTVNKGELYVLSGGTANNITVSSQGIISVDGGTANSTTVNSDGRLDVSSGGTANNTTVNRGGNLNVSSGGVANSTTTVNKGELYVLSGGTANNITVSSQGIISVDGGTANSTTVVNSLGGIWVRFDGTANNTTVNSGGKITIERGTANNTTVNSRGSMWVFSGGTANSTTVNSLSFLEVSSGGTANDTIVDYLGRFYVGKEGVANNTTLYDGTMYVSGIANGIQLNIGERESHYYDSQVSSMGALFVSSGGTANDITINSGAKVYVSNRGTVNGVTANSGGTFYISRGGKATGVVENGGYVYVNEDSDVTFTPNTFSGVTLSNALVTVHTGTTANGTIVSSGGSMHVSSGGAAAHTTINFCGCLYVSSGGTATCTTVNSTGMGGALSRMNGLGVLGGTATDTTVNSGGFMIVTLNGTANNTTVNSRGSMSVEGGTATATTVNSSGYLEVFSGGTVNSTTINSGGIMRINYGGTITGQMVFDDGALVFISEGAILDFNISELTPEAGARVNNLAIIQGTPSYTLTVSAEQAKGIYTLAEGAAGFNSTITVQNTFGNELGTLTVGETLTIDKTDYLLTNENGVLSVTVTDSDTPTQPKWTYMVYMAADSNIGTSALYDIIGMQQAEVDSEIDIYVLADRCAVDAGYPDEIVTVNGTYKWDSLWPDTRVGKITYSPGLTVTVDWESWGELDTASSETLNRFVDWVQEESPAENYGLILWDHGEEDGELCWDLTTDPNWNACFKVSEVSDLLNEKGNIPIVIFNNCLLASEIVATQLAGSTEVIVASEPVSMGESTYNYHAFFNTITAGMTPQEMAEIMVRNVISPGMLTMLSSIDVRDSRLGDALEALADAVAEADNDADKTVLTNAMLKAYQDGFCYTGSLVQQSDLGYMIQQVTADSNFENTSEGFKKALADVKTVLEEVVLAVRSVPVKRGTGIAYCNTIATLLQCAVTGRTPEKMDSLIKSHIISSYKSNPLWGGMLYDLGLTFLNRNADQLFRPASFHVIDVEGLVEGRTVAAMDLGCFSGMGEQNYGIALIGDAFCRIVITDEDKSTGIISVGNESGKEIKVSLLAADGSIVVAENTNGISFENLAPGDYYIRLLSETNCDVTVTFDANWMTGVDRFDYAGSGQNLPGVNGNGSIDTATILDAGYYTGLLTCKGDTDYYRVGNIHTEQYTVIINGREDWTVAEYDENGTLVQKGQYSELDNYITLTMNSMNYLLVEGTADMSKQEVNRYFLNIFKNENGSGGVVQLDDLTGSKDEVSWESSTISEYVLECSTDGFEHVFQYTTSGTAVDLLNLPAGTYQWRVKANMDSAEWNDGNEIVSDNTSTNPKVFRSKADASDDIFFAMPNGTWDSIYYAQNVGSVNDWTGTNEIVSANGKGRIQDLFFGSADPSTLCLTDSENGDALFLDDMYTGLPEDIEDNTGRLFRLQSIMAGAGDDIIDMTSQRFEYSDGNLSIFGGDGDDIIWASKGKNLLYGDAGNDRIVGASSNDVIVGGIGNDRMHGGGGDDIFTFGENWGVDTVEQLATGSVTLWFASGDESKWNPDTMTYTDGENSVKVSGVAADKITLKFGDDGSDQFAALSGMGAFFDATTERIFEESGKGVLVSL